MLRPVRSFQMDKLMVEVTQTGRPWGKVLRCSGRQIAPTVGRSESINVVFAAAPSKTISGGPSQVRRC